MHDDLDHDLRPDRGHDPTGPRSGADLDTADAVTGAGRRRALLLVLPLVLLAFAAGAWALVSSLRVPATLVSLQVPQAPRLTAANPNQKVYRIDATRSSVSYDVDETLAGSTHTAHGTTKGIAGDVLVDEARPQASQLGEIVVNVEQLTSDQAMRDDRLRGEFLQSTHHPLAHLRTRSIEGLPDRIVTGTKYELKLQADLEVKAQSHPVVLDATVWRDEQDELHVQARTTVVLSDYGIGPISLGPMVTSGNEAVLTVDAVAVDAAKGLPYTEAVASPTGGGSTVAVGAGGGPSFGATVQPILQRNCASCHQPGQAGADVWSLSTAGDAARVAGGLALATGSGYMPPWPASSEGVALAHDRRLPEADVRAIADWAAAGGRLDVDPGTRIDPAPEADAVTIRHDQVMASPEPYQGSTDLTNDYRCIVMDPGFTEPTYVTGYEFLPDQRRIVHHALAFKVSAAGRTQTDQLDADDPGAGWGCYVGAMGPGGSARADGSNGSSELIMAWAPGQGPTKFPEGSGILMEPGDHFVLQIHYHYAHEAPADQSHYAIETERGVELDRVVTNTYLAPAEIPCTPEEQGPLCDRKAAIAQLSEEFGPAAAVIADGLHFSCRTTPDQMDDLDGTVAHAWCEQRVRADGEVVGIFGHEHQIGRTFRMTLNPGTPEEKVLLDIPVWDFAWQMVYEPAEPLVLKAGDVIRVDCTWDRKLIQSSEPRYVTWAEGTEDEMCYSAVSTRQRR